MNKKKVALISTGALGVLSVGALSLIGNYFYNLAINPKTSKEAIFGSKKESKKLVERQLMKPYLGYYVPLITQIYMLILLMG